MPEQIQNLFILGGLFLILTLLTFSLHYIRFTFNRSIFLAYIVSLWFITSYLGDFNLNVAIDILNFQINFDYASLFYSFIFIGILLVYISEGVSEARNLIYVSIVSQLFILLMQIFIYHFASVFIPTILQNVVELLFQPNYLQSLGSLFTAIMALLSALVIYQFLENRISPLLGLKSRWLVIMIALMVAMFIDTILFLVISPVDAFIAQQGAFVATPDSFGGKFLFYFLAKALIILTLILPLEFYLRYIQNKHKIESKKGTLDIFSKIDSLEQELARKNKELQEYSLDLEAKVKRNRTLSHLLQEHNRNLEVKVEERTKEIQDKQKATETELAMASEFQRVLLPDEERINHVTNSILYIPYAKISGDLYDFALIEDKNLYLFIADIAGHGIPTILAWSMCNMVISRTNFRKHNPKDIVQRVANEMLESKMDIYLSAFVCFIDMEERSIEYVNAGHVPPLLISHKDQNITELNPTSGLVGIPDKTPFVQSKLTYNSGSRLVLYTDCVTEVKKSKTKEEFGLENLKNNAVKYLSHSPEEFHKKLTNELYSHAGVKHFSDDLTMITVDLPSA